MPQHYPFARFVVLGFALAAAAVGITSGAAPQAPARRAASAQHPVVVELFQSQGCSSCPPADADLNLVAARPEVLALSFAVTYWDRLGWKDTFGSPRFSARQADYAHAGTGEVATPEFIVNGSRAVVGADRRALDAAIGAAGAPAGGPTISTGASAVHVAGGMAGTPGTVWLVRYDPRTLAVPIHAGENSGRTIAHRNVVRDLVRLGAWSGAPATYPVPASREAGLTRAVLVQRDHGGPIIAAARID